MGYPYYQALAETLTAINREIVNQLGLESQVEVICDRFICLGDRHDRIILEGKS